MKRVITFILALMMCVSLAACKNETPETPQAAAPQFTEEIAKQLVEKNLDCYFIFYVSPLTCTQQQNSDGYFGTDTSYLENYEALETLVKSTYTESRADIVLNYPSKENPLYKNVDGLIFEDPTAVEPVEYDILWDDYSVEITQTSEDECSFTLKTTDMNSKEYTTTAQAVLENNEWKLTEVIY